MTILLAAPAHAYKKPANFDTTVLGGVIFMSSEIDLTITNVANFRYNKAKSGGVIYNNGGTIATAGTTSITLSNNTANGGSITIGSGGAIYTQGGTITTSETANLIISNNTANHFGGGIFKSDGILTISGSTVTISGNTAGNYGGGICNYQGTIHFVGGTLTLSENTSASGGGIFNSNSTGMGGPFTFSESTVNISNNTATYNGGGIANAGFFTFSKSTVTISGNKANGDEGGGIQNGLNDPMTFSESTVTISNNTAKIFGGGISNHGSLTFSGGTLTLSGNKTAYGGAISMKAITSNPIILFEQNPILPASSPNTATSKCPIAYIEGSGSFSIKTGNTEWPRVQVGGMGFSAYCATPP